MDVCIKIIERLDMFETKDASRTKKERGAVLVFLPGEQGPDSKEQFYHDLNFENQALTWSIFNLILSYRVTHQDG